MCTHIHIWEFLFQDFCDSVTVEGHSEGARRSSVENHLNKKQGLNPGDKIHRDKKEEVKNAKSLWQNDQNKRDETCSKLFARETTSSATALNVEEIYFSVLIEFLMTEHFKTTLDHIYLNNVFAVEVVSPDLIRGISCSNVQVTWAIGNIDLLYFLIALKKKENSNPCKVMEGWILSWVSAPHGVRVQEEGLRCACCAHLAVDVFTTSTDWMVFFRSSPNVQRRKGNRVVAMN